MGLDGFSNTNLIIDGVVREYSSFINYLIEDGRIEFHLDLDNQAHRKGIDYLISTEKKLLKKVESNNSPRDLSEWEIDVRDRLGQRLELLDLNMMEFAKSKNLNLFLNIIVVSENYIEYATKFLEQLKKSNRDNWINEILKVAKKTKSNLKIWEEFEQEFKYEDVDRSDVGNLNLICRLGRDFYKNLYTKLLIVLEQFSDLDKVSESDVIDSFTVVINSFVTKEKTIIEVLTRIKDTYDDKVEDVNFKSLLKKIVDKDLNLKAGSSFLLISKLRIVDEYIRKYPISEMKKRIGTISIPNNLHVHNYDLLADDINILRDSLRDNNFIQAIRLNEFSSIFSNKNIDKPIKWLGTQAELSYFVKSVKPWLVTERAYLKRAGNIFVDESGGLFNNIGSPNSPIPVEKEIVLRNVIAMFNQSIEEIRRKYPPKH